MDRRQVMMRRYRLAATMAAAAVAYACCSASIAQSYPAKPVRMIVASSAGSNPDTIGRVLASALAQQFGQQVIVDNRAGAGGNIGAEVAAKAAPDGYTIFLAHTNHSINSALYRKLSYDILNDFSPLTLVALSAFVAVVHPSLPAKSVGDLLKIARARPGDLNYASAGTGSGTFFAAEYFNGLGGVKMVHVPYTGGGPALASMLAGETSIYFTPLATGLAHIRSGRLRALGVTSPKRLRELPEVPPIGETLRGYEVLSWSGLMVPVKTSKDIAAVVYKSAVAAMSRPEAVKRFEDLGFIVQSGRPEEMESYVKNEMDKYARLIKQVGMPLQ
ncbi:MAG: tripartite tricarboxylate transporter substrate binding protein [Burkholderiales bacterium]